MLYQLLDSASNEFKKMEDEYFSRLQTNDLSKAYTQSRNMFFLSRVSWPGSEVATKDG